MKLSLGAVLLAACSFPTPSEQYACRTSDDCESNRMCTQGYCVLRGQTGMDVGGDGSNVDCMSFTSRLFDACAIPPPAGALDLSSAGVYTFDTSNGALMDPGGASTMPPSAAMTNGRVVSVNSVSISAAATLRVIGTAPLVLASWGTIQVDGTIDASSTGVVGGAGAGANPTGCSTHAAAPGNANNEGGGGGGGGGGQGAGGRGGNGDPSANGTGGLGGALVAAPLLLGGCAGARGGNGSSIAGDGGDGGGAVQLTARTSITISATGKANAGGAGGKQAQPSGDGGGGGGGGAGGMIGLEAPTVTVASGAILAANGGGGGEGGGNMGTAQAGKNGLLSATRATGGAGGSGGDGGLGAGGAVVIGGPGMNDGAGGGGAGGAAGFITVKAQTKTLDAGAVFSPPATMVP